jgi:hypothetical protein
MKFVSKTNINQSDSDSSDSEFSDTDNEFTNIKSHIKSPVKSPVKSYINLDSINLDSIKIDELSDYHSTTIEPVEIDTPSINLMNNRKYIGPRGIVGPDGRPGLPGIRGKNGEKGPPGPRGIVGPDGIPGLVGMQGEKGLDGSNGIQGKMGLTGSGGIDGIQGFPGPTGVKGEMGEKGSNGIQGFPGPTGSKGIRGVCTKSVLYNSLEILNLDSYVDIVAIPYDGSKYNLDTCIVAVRVISGSCTISFSDITHSPDKINIIGTLNIPEGLHVLEWKNFKNIPEDMSLLQVKGKTSGSAQILSFEFNQQLKQ